MLTVEERDKALSDINPARNKVAVCFSGQIRTWRKCVDSWKHILKVLGQEDADVFCHLWDYNTIPNSITKDDREGKLVEQEEINAILNILQPKKFLVESRRDFKPYNANQPIDFPGFLSQYYGIMRSANLKREYEIENDFRYSAVARSRYDILYTEAVTGMYHNMKPGTMKTMGMIWDAEKHRGRISDLFWVADSDSYDIIADYYINQYYMNKDMFPRKPEEMIYPETIFFHYIKKNNITMIPNFWELKVMRESLELSHTKKEGGYEVW